MKFRIFISSVQDEFAAERRGLKDWLTTDAVLSLFVESVFVFEDVPSRGVLPADRFLDEVRKAHIYIGLFGERYSGARISAKRMGRITSAAYAKMVSIGQKTAVRDLADTERKDVVNGVGKARGRYFVLRTNTDTNRTNRTDDSVREKFVCRGSVVDAYGSTGPGLPFVVLRGSVVSSGMMPSMKRRTPSYFKLGCGLENDGTIVNGVFAHDFEFASPSAASSVVTGRPSNGRLDWMTADGRSLKEVQEEWQA